MGAAGSPYAAFQRALRARNATRALVAAADLPRLSLADALALCLLLRDEKSDLFARAAARWAVRFGSETPGVDVRELGLVVAALASLETGNPRPGALGLLGVCRKRRLRDAEIVLRRWLQ